MLYYIDFFLDGIRRKNIGVVRVRQLQGGMLMKVQLMNLSGQQEYDCRICVHHNLEMTEVSRMRVINGGGSTELLLSEEYFRNDSAEIRFLFGENRYGACVIKGNCVTGRNVTGRDVPKREPSASVIEHPKIISFEDFTEKEEKPERSLAAANVEEKEQSFVATDWEKQEQVFEAEDLEKQEQVFEAEDLEKQERSSKKSDGKDSLLICNKEKTPRLCHKKEEEKCSKRKKLTFASTEQKWEQLKEYFPIIHPFSNQEGYIVLAPADLSVLGRESQSMEHNSFLLHGYYNYRHIILGKYKTPQSVRFYLGVPGTYEEREQMMASMFGFEGYEHSGGLGYYMKEVQLQ